MLPVVFVDANILFSRTLRAWLFNILAADATPAFEVVTSEDVIAEAIARIRDTHPRMSGGAISAVREQIATMMTIVRDYEIRSSLPELGDMGDLHVLAAAEAAKAGYLVTMDSGLLNLPDDSGLEFEIYAPDDFLVLADAQSPSRVLEATRAHLRHQIGISKQGRQKETMQIVGALERAGCPDFAKIVNQHLATLSASGPRFRA